MKTPTNPAHKPATLDDVAAHVGVSRMAVSVVLNGARSGTRVSEAKRELILAAAKELNYRPNLVARSLARSASHVFGFYSGFDYLDVRNPFVAEITAGLLEACSASSRDLLLHTLFRGQDIKSLYDELVGGKIDGLVIWAPDDDPLVALLREGHLPVVSIVEAIQPFPSVGVDDYGGALQIARLLFDRGHRSMVYVTQKRPSASRMRRQDAIQDAAEQLGIEIETLVEPTAEEWSATFGTKDGSKKGPTAAVCWNDMVAHWALGQCRRQGLAVPEDLAITGFDGIRSPIETDLTLTTIRAPWAQVASTAIHCLLDLCQGNEVPQETVLPVELVLGDTA